MYTSRAFSILSVLVLACTCVAQAASETDYSKLKKDVEELKQRLAKKDSQAKVAGPIGRADASVAGKYGPNTVVKTKDGKLTLGGLLQVWQYSVQNDTLDFSTYEDRFVTNEDQDNDSYRIRRAEIKFTLDITPDITAVVMFDPTGGDESNTFAAVPFNQGLVGRRFQSGLAPQIGNTSNQSSESSSSSDQSSELADGRNMQRVRRLAGGFVLSNRLLQDAYINYHTPLIPHHDFTIGQFKPPMSEEGNRNSGQLDFAERAMVNQFSNQRDMGLMAHGTWWDSRFQYWVGFFNNAGSFHNTFASNQNRSDDNDEKDIAYRILVRPVWNQENWGSLELGYSAQYGVHGEAGGGFTQGTTTFDVDGLGLQQAHAMRQYAWLWYRPGGPVRGWWLRGEWAQIKDRAFPGGGVTQIAQNSPQVFDRSGWYFSTGYKLSDSIWADDLKDHSNWLIKMAYNVEFAYRYDVFQAIVVEGAYDARADPTAATAANRRLLNRTDLFKVQVHTAGINYYWKAYNVRTQLNYMWVDEDQGHQSPGNSLTPSTRRVREVRNNIFLVSHQIMW